MTTSRQLSMRNEEQSPCHRLLMVAWTDDIAVRTRTGDIAVRTGTGDIAVRTGTGDIAVSMCKL